jgi:hypothetical protein
VVFGAFCACADCRRHIPAHLAFRSGGISSDDAKAEWAKHVEE